MNLDPRWILGFVDAKGCFFVEMIKPQNSTVKQVRVGFTVTLHKKSIKILFGMKRYFQCGRIQEEDMRIMPIFNYTVNNEQHLMKCIVPFFEQYPLLTEKRQDFLFFRKFVIRLSNEEHLMKSPKTGKVILNSALMDK